MTPDDQREIDAHLEHLADDLRARGLSPEEAARRARRKFGNVAGVREELYEMNRVRWIDAIGRDLRFAARVLSKSPGFTLAAVATLALGIGANTAIYSVVDALLFRPLEYPRPEQLAQVVTRVKGPNVESVQDAQDGRTWEAVRDHATAFDRAAFGSSSGVNAFAGGRALYLQQQRVGAGFFRVLGVAPAIGREFTVEEDRLGGPPVVVLSHGLWKRLSDGDAGAVGRTMSLKGEPHTIIGVMPEQFRSNAKVDLWTPLRAQTSGEGVGTNYQVIARIAGDSSWARADADAAAVGVEGLKHRPFRSEVTARLGLQPLKAGLTEGVRRPLYLLWGAVGLVRVFASLTLAGLLLVRGSARRREIATRMALGGGRAAVVRQLLVESLVIAALGGVAGVAIGWAGLEGLRVLGKDVFDFGAVVALDGRVMAATALFSLATTLVFGLFPAVHASRVDLQAVLHAGGGRGVAGGRAHWPRRLLVVGEVALSATLLVGAGLLIRSLGALEGLDPGFDPANLLTAKLSLTDARYRSSAKVAQLIERSVSEIERAPGVEGAAVSLGLPYERILNMGFRRPGAEKSQMTNMTYVSPGYFRTLRMTLKQGREFTAADQAGAAPVAIVNETFAKLYFKDSEVLGTTIQSGKEAREIVGVVGDVQQRPGWGNFGPLAATPILYVPVAQTSDSFVELVHTWFQPAWIVRTRGDVAGLPDTIRRAVESVDAELPIASFRNFDEVRGRTLAGQRFLATVLSALAALALGLASIGIFGLVAQSVAERTRELGIRLALGATRASTVRSVAAPAMALCVCGLIAGAAGAAALARLAASAIWGVSPADPVTFAGVSAALLAAAAVASVLPALRVLRLDPAETLRHE